MNQEQNIEQKLWSFIDGHSSKEEISTIEKLLDTNLEWKNKYLELLNINQVLKSTELEQPSMRFTKNVMEEIARLHIAPATKNYINNKIIWGLGTFFITLIIGFLVYGIGQIDWSAESTTKLPVDIKPIDFSKVFTNNFVNGFMMINVILGLFLLDRVLANRRKKFQSES